MSTNGSVKHLECWYWRVIGHCDYDEERCLYAHHATGQIAGKPIKREAGKPAVAGRNADAVNPVYRNWRGPAHGVFDINVSHQLSHIRQKAPRSTCHASSAPISSSPSLPNGGPRLSITSPPWLLSGPSNPISRSTTPTVSGPLNLSTWTNLSHAPSRSPVTNLSHSSYLSTSSNLSRLSIPSNPWEFSNMRTTTSSFPMSISPFRALNQAPPSSSTQADIQPNLYNTIDGPPNAMIPEPWATHIRLMKSGILYSVEDLHKGVRLWHISEEDTGPGAKMLLDAFWEHCRVMIDTLDTMAEMIGQQVPQPVEQ